MAEPFTFIFRVRYAECDPQGIVFNGRYVEYADVAFTEFIRALLGGYEALLEQGLDMQVVNLNVAWQSSARADDVLRATVMVDSVGTTSAKLSVALKHHETSREIANIDIVYVMVSASEQLKKPVPDKLRETFLAGAPGVLVNHAGI